MAEYFSRLDPRAQALHSHQPEHSLAQEDKDIRVAVHDGATDNLGPEGKESHELVQEETEESLNVLIEDLEAEDGKVKDPEVLTIPVAPGEERLVPPQLIQTDPAHGLSNAEVILVRKKYGLNRLKEEKRNHVLKFLGFFVGPVQFVMEGAALLAAGLKDWIDFGIICGLLLLNAAVGFCQEYHAGNIVDSLKETLALKATVIRNGKRMEIGVEEVVPGDIVHVEVTVGDSVTNIIEEALYNDLGLRQTFGLKRSIRFENSNAPIPKREIEEGTDIRGRRVRRRSPRIAARDKNASSTRVSEKHS
ncbi:ATPase P-type K/Mg/Cd/Cu/Zn/Na/Ca/Na/H-transporter [Penicillium lagena]|uniref:ATPase P-type K/Mg/Cd/Cu/Zn/Na/Ca/Na/H-transporter n=1 Tax=Penicillium lagena TaxID=94218 RepID=UPI0025407C8E|nr:ATPase P-type K/Mg/Cd/Cu/Zn/Na/Ca/Na/H-transporter [Penicillium lagena]KAJ5623966.1 ATPase P-type K/Mg/Cd/Cu/Zn/Na/Ca/Na/H-transporter [Penicillium lagena]